MATTRLSPAASLLRHSRLFSLPPPLPRPSHEASTTVIFGSDTATLQHPIRASIETTPAALARGDWGLKRSLPQKSTTGTTTPVIRIGAVDSADHITDFDSAADHTLTLRKWQEMDVPITSTSVKTSSYPLTVPVSVFEDNLDRTEVGGPGSTPNLKRWKYGGPWLASKTNGEFEEYVLKKVKGRRQEFLHFLRGRIREKQVAASRRDAMEKGDSFVPPPELSEEDFKAEIIRLRQSSGQLYEWIWQFLDLPRLSSKSQNHASESFLEAITGDQDLEKGPPITHPSAGLSYLRTSSHVPNHPILGPVGFKPPVLARVLYQPSKGRGRVLFGVGGVVSQEVLGSPYRDSKEPPSSSVEVDSEGGPKGWVHPQRATIDSYGRIQLAVEKAHDNSIAFWENHVDLGFLATARPATGDRRPVDSTPLGRPRDDGQRLRARTPPGREYLGKEASDGRMDWELRRVLKSVKGKEVFTCMEAMEGS